MKTLVLANQKGGVGKSAVATLLSHYFVRHGRRVLAIDLDHQGNFCAPLIMSKRACVAPISVRPPADARRRDGPGGGIRRRTGRRPADAARAPGGAAHAVRAPLPRFLRSVDAALRRLRDRHPSESGHPRHRGARIGRLRAVAPAAEPGGDRRRARAAAPPARRLSQDQGDPQPEADTDRPACRRWSSRRRFSGRTSREWSAAICRC